MFDAHGTVVARFRRTLPSSWQFGCERCTLLRRGDRNGHPSASMSQESYGDLLLVGCSNEPNGRHGMQQRLHAPNGNTSSVRSWLAASHRASTQRCEVVHATRSGRRLDSSNQDESLPFALSLSKCACYLSGAPDPFDALRANGAAYSVPFWLARNRRVSGQRTVSSAAATRIKQV